MSVEEKREIVSKYCYSIKRCEGCTLKNRTWIHRNSSVECLNLSMATEEELDEALALIHKDESPGERVARILKETTVSNPIKPAYYNDTKITPFDVIDDWKLNFYLGNAIKYIKRAGKKADNSRLQDLKKVREYIDHEIKAEEDNDD